MMKPFCPKTWVSLAKQVERAGFHRVSFFFYPTLIVIYSLYHLSPTLSSSLYSHLLSIPPSLPPYIHTYPSSPPSFLPAAQEIHCGIDRKTSPVSRWTPGGFISRIGSSSVLFLRRAQIQSSGRSMFMAVSQIRVLTRQKASRSLPLTCPSEEHLGNHALLFSSDIFSCSYSRIQVRFPTLCVHTHSCLPSLKELSRRWPLCLLNVGFFRWKQPSRGYRVVVIKMAH